MNMDEITARIDDTGDCWLWTGTISVNGYGHLTWNGKTVRAHRFIYEALIGEVPVGLELDHLCRVRHCVNPRHLEPVTRQENVRRGVSPAAINAAKERCIRGHDLSGSNLYERPDGGGRQCRACRKAANAEYRANNREKLRKYDRALRVRAGVA